MTPSPACRRAQEGAPLFRIIRVPLALDQFFRPLEEPFRWHPCSDFRWRVVVIACMWGRRQVANRSRYLEVGPHRTRLNNFFLVARWDAAAALRQKAHALLLALPPQPGDTVYRMSDDSQKAKRGSQMAYTSRAGGSTRAAMGSISCGAAAPRPWSW